MKRKNWKVILEYEIGILLLIAVVIAALFGPDLYASWQDERQLEQIVLSNRENIRFLDVNSLDIAGRMSLLKDVEYLSWSISDYEAVSSDRELQKEKRLVKQWIDCGILPEQTEKLLLLPEEDQTGLFYDRQIVPGTLILDQSVLDVMFGYQAIIQHDEKSNTDQLNTLITIMDRDKDMMYYAGVFGSMFWDWMAESIGPGKYSSYFELQKKWLAEGQNLSEVEISEWGDLAAVCMASDCEAENPEISFGSEDYLYRDFALHYGNFDGFARKQIGYCDEGGFGMVIMFGTSRWSGIMFGSSRWNEKIYGMEGGLGIIAAGTVDQWLMDPLDLGDPKSYPQMPEVWLNQ